MYNKIRMGIMLTGFTMVILVALSYSGNVSDSCMSEWQFFYGVDKKDMELDSKIKSVSSESILEKRSVDQVDNSADYEVNNSHRSSDFDLIFPKFLFTF